MTPLHSNIELSLLHIHTPPPIPQNELVSFRGSLEEHQLMVESAQARVEDKERSELEMKVEVELMREELEGLRCSEDTLQNRFVTLSQYLVWS